MNEPITKKHVDTLFGRIAHLEAGSTDKPPVLFVHGIPTSGYLWRHVLRFLQNDFHCLAPDLMGLGDTEVHPERTAFDMESQAEMLGEFMTQLGHRRFAVVAHDQGGAAAQIMAARFPERLTALVLTDCVAYDNWPVPAIRRLQSIARFRPLSSLMSRSGVGELLETRTRLSAFRRGVYQRDRLSDETIREYLRPMRQSAAGQERFRRFVLAGNPRCTLRVVDALRQLEVPTFVVWAADDRYLSPSWGKRLAEEIPSCEGFELVPFCGHFWQEERPAEFASHIGRFLADAVHRPVATDAESIAADGGETKKKKKCNKLPVVDQPSAGPRLREV